MAAELLQGDASTSGASPTTTTRPQGLHVEPSRSTTITPALPTAPHSPAVPAKSHFRRRGFRSAASMPLPAVDAVTGEHPFDLFTSRGGIKRMEGTEMVLRAEDDLQEFDCCDDEPVCSPGPMHATLQQLPLSSSSPDTSPTSIAAYKHSRLDTVHQVPHHDQQQQSLMALMPRSEDGTRAVRARALRSLTTLHREIQPWCESPTGAAAAMLARTHGILSGSTAPESSPFARKAHIDDTQQTEREESAASLSELLHDGRAPVPPEEEEQVSGALMTFDHLGLLDDDDASIDLRRLSELLDDGRGKQAPPAVPSTASRPGIGASRALRASQSIISRMLTTDEAPCFSPRRNLRSLQSFGGTSSLSPRTYVRSGCSDDGRNSISSTTSSSLKNMLGMLTPSRSKVFPSTPDGTVHGGEKAAASILVNSGSGGTGSRRSITSPGYSPSVGSTASISCKSAVLPQALASPDTPRHSVSGGLARNADSGRLLKQVASIRRHCWVDDGDKPVDPQ